MAATYAGLFTTALSTEDASQLKRVAVVSVVGDTLRARQVGLTVFGNKSFDASKPDWALDADVRALMQKRDQCTRLPIAAVWYDKWSDYTDAEKHTTLELVQSFVRQQITMALFDLHLLPT